MTDLVIFGIGGLAKETIPLIDYINKASKKTEFRIRGFVISEQYYHDDMTFMRHPVLGDTRWLIDHKDEVSCVCCVGNPVSRSEIMVCLKEKGIRFATLISPGAYIGEGVRIGEGCIIQYRSLIAPDVYIGDGVLFNTDVVIGHDTVIEDYVTCFPRTQISGHCIIKRCASIGSMSFIIEKTSVGEKAVVAPGSIVFKRVKAGTRVMGNPAHKVDL